MSGEAPQKTITEIRKLAAIMFTDMVGFSRQMGADEPRMLRVLDLHNQVIQQAVVAHYGHVIKTMGDGFLVDFPSVVNAVQCAQQIQSQLRVHNAVMPRDEQIRMRIGIHLGDVVQRDGDVFGDGVNIAARLQSLAAPDTICISEVVYKEVIKKTPLDAVVALGRPKLKNIAERFQIYALLPAAPKGFRQKLQRVLCWTYVWKKQHDLAMAEGLKAIALDPNDADSYSILSQALNFAGKPEEAIGFVEKAMRLNPHYPAAYINSLGWAYGLLGRDEEAIVAVKRAVALNPDWLPPHLNLAAIYSNLSREEEARAEATEMLRISPNFSLESFRERIPYKDSLVTERFLTALRKAGLK